MGHSVQTFFHTEDHKKLQARISWSVSDIASIDKIAIIAHPYGSLGGNYNNNVVVSLERYFTTQRYVTICYNARGVSGSTGRGSWDGEAECQDYQTIVDFCISPGSSSQSEEALNRFKNCRFNTIACVGYSYGSLAASSARLNVTDKTIYYVLISYPIGVLWALTRGRTSTFTRRLVEAGAESNAKGLVIFGNHDQFTGAARYETWTAEIREQNCRFEIKCLEDMDHFWAGSENELVEAMHQWQQKEGLV